MTLVLGSIRQPKRIYPRKIGEYTTRQNGVYGYVRVYEPEEMVDILGRRSERAQVLANLGTLPLEARVWNWRTSASDLYIWNPASWQASTVYYAGAHISSDGKIWETTAGGTSGTGGGPTGAGPVTEGSVTWFVVDATVAANINVYSVNVYDVDVGEASGDVYPEDQLDALTTYADWLATGLPADPTTVLPDVHARTIDAAALPEDVAAVARAVKLGA